MTKVIPHNKIKTILISRIDNIGDVVLSLPLAVILKKTFPDVKLIFLARKYVGDLISICPYVDTFLDWEDLKGKTDEEVLGIFISLSIDVFVHISPLRKLARLAKKANIPYRVGTLSRYYHWWMCNCLVSLSRSKSPLHEAQLNLLLLKAFGLKTDYSLDELKTYNTLQFSGNFSNKVTAIVNPNKINLIIHPGSHLHGQEWPEKYYQELINKLSDQYNIIITGSAQEKIRFNVLLSHCKNATDTMGQLTLNELIQLILKSDALISHGTGPLHLAAALGKNVLGLFPKTKRINIGRWGPLGKQAYAIESSVICDNCQHKKKTCSCMEAISVTQVINSINAILNEK